LAVIDRLDAVEDEFLTVEAELSDPAVLNDSGVLRQKSKRYKELTPIVTLIRAHRAASDDAAAARELLTVASPHEREMMRAELVAAETEIDRLAEEIRLLLLPRDPNDGRSVIVEIRGAEGGEEANLFARDLFDMYVGYASQQGWSVDVLSSDVSDLGGLNQTTFMVKGDTTWGRLKFEGGTHRVQRVPVTESQGRIHTSSATVLILAEAEEVDVEIDEKDLQIDVYRASGPGGQGVNTTDSAVRITHKPTGIPPAAGRPAAGRREGIGRAQVTGRNGRTGRKDPDLQLQGEPGHRSSHRFHDLSPARRAGRQSHRDRRSLDRRRAGASARER